MNMQNRPGDVKWRSCSCLHLVISQLPVIRLLDLSLFVHLKLMVHSTNLLPMVRLINLSLFVQHRPSHISTIDTGTRPATPRRSMQSQAEASQPLPNHLLDLPESVSASPAEHQSLSVVVHGPHISHVGFCIKALYKTSTRL